MTGGAVYFLLYHIMSITPHHQTRVWLSRFWWGFWWGWYLSVSSGVVTLTPSPPTPLCSSLPTFLFCNLCVLKFYDYWCGSFFTNFAVNSVDSSNLEIHVLYSWEVYLYYFFDHFFSFNFFIFFHLNSLFMTSWTYHLIFLIHSLSFSIFLSLGSIF